MIILALCANIFEVLMGREGRQVLIFVKDLHLVWVKLICCLSLRIFLVSFVACWWSYGIGIRNKSRSWGSNWSNETLTSQMGGWSRRSKLNGESNPDFFSCRSLCCLLRCQCCNFYDRSGFRRKIKASTFSNFWHPCLEKISGELWFIVLKDILQVK